MGKIFTAIGNACTDLVAFVSDEFLEQRHLRKFYCTFITDKSDLEALKSDMGNYQMIAGGAGANVAHVISALGGEAHFISKIADDQEGITFKNHMTENGVTCHFPPASPADSGSPQVPTLITPDGERTFVSFDGVARGFSDTDYDFDLLKKTDVLYLDGYCFCSPYTGESFIKAARFVRQHGGHATFNLGDIGIYESYPDAVQKLLDVCDSVICNQAEADILFGKFPTLHDLAVFLAGKFAYGAVTRGANGAIVFSDGKIENIPACPSLTPVDTNGAGDHFSGGFIFGLMHQWSLLDAGRLGIICATDCLSHTGARPESGFSSLKHLAEKAILC